MHARRAHAVEAVHAPLEVRLHAARVIKFVVLAVIGFLKANHAVHAVARKRAVVLLGERHHLDFEVREIGFGEVERLGEVGRAGFGGVFARHEQQVLEWAEALDGFVLAHHFFGREDCARHLVGHVETAVHAGICAGVGEIEGNEHQDGAPEAFLGVAARELRHRFEKRLGGGRYQRHEVFYVAVRFCQSAAHVVGGFGMYAPRDVVPIVFQQFF